MNVLLAALVLSYGCGACLPGGHNGIAAIRADGTHRQALLTSSIPSHLFWYPTWSPDAKRFAYVHENGVGKRRLWIALPGGRRQRPLTNGGPDKTDFEPVWSPDGKRIAFVRGYELWVIGANGRGARRLYAWRHGAVPLDSPPAWSPDGRRLAFIADDQLFVIRADGARLVRIPTTPAANPAWSPDGRSIYYMSGRQNGFIPWVPHRYVLATHRDGYFLARPGPDYVAGAWSPDCRYFAYALILPTANGTSVDDLWVLRLADRKRIHVTQVPGGIFGVSWKPAPAR